MSQNPLTHLIRQLADPVGLVAAADLEVWPPRFVRACLDAGLLTRVEDAQHILCPHCEQPHVVEVGQCRIEGRLRLIGTCAESGAFPVDEELVRQWRPSLMGFAKLVRRGLGCPEEPVTWVGTIACDIGYVIQRGQALRIILCSSEPDWKLLRGSKALVVLITPPGLHLADLPDNTHTVPLSELIEWHAETGMICRTDHIIGVLGDEGTLHVDGFSAPFLIRRGTKHHVPTLRPQLALLLEKLAGRDSIAIDEVVFTGEGAVWNQRWNPNDQKLVNAIRTALNELKNALLAAKPPLREQYSLRIRKEIIERKMQE